MLKVSMWYLIWKVIDRTTSIPCFFSFIWCLWRHKEHFRALNFVLQYFVCVFSAFNPNIFMWLVFLMFCIAFLLNRISHLQHFSVYPFSISVILQKTIIILTFWNLNMPGKREKTYKKYSSLHIMPSNRCSN